MIAEQNLKIELEKYELIDEIGHGGMATVYRARDKRLGRDVAIKVIHRHLRENAEVAARFAGEARAVAKVKHPNIVEVYDVSDDNEPERYLVVELVRGTTLRRLLLQRGHLPAEVAVAIALQAARGLEHAHRQGVVHRDVKPENVLLELPQAVEVDSRSLSEQQHGRAARVKITDFGIAKLLDAQGVTSTGQVLGSPAHMAPEQIEGGAVGATADVFGLGVLLYEAIVGKLPFDGNNPAQVLRRVLDGKFTPPERARPTVGLELSRIIERALAHLPEDRYQGAAELAAALEAELSRLGFEDPELELDRYLRDPDAYDEHYTSVIVNRLVTLGRAARADRDMVQAASQFNRALAFRPDDPDLIVEVAGLAKARRLERMLSFVARAAGIVVLAAAAGYGLFQLVPKVGQTKPEATHSPKPVPTKQALDKRFRKAPVASTAPGAPAEARPKRTVVPSNRRAAKPVHQLDAGSDRTPPTRPVRILIAGPQNATVLIDGNAQPQWFTKSLDLPLGSHTFEFIPPDAKCCEKKTSRAVEVVAGEGPQIVRGTIEFRPAILQFNSPVGTEATCGTMGVFRGPSSNSIPMHEPVLRGRCTVIPPPEGGGAPKEIDVTLSPGRTFAINWP